MRRNKKWQMKEITERSRQWSRLEVVPIQQSCLVMWVLTTDNRHSLNPTMSKLIDSSCSTAAFRLITSWMTSLWDIQQMPITWRPSCFIYCHCSLRLLLGEKLLSPQRAKSRGTSLLSATDEGPTGNHRQPLYEAVWHTEWTQRPTTFCRQSR